jgi:hypothetical protein
VFVSLSLAPKGPPKVPTKAPPKGAPMGHLNGHPKDQRDKLGTQILVDWKKLLGDKRSGLFRVVVSGIKGTFSNIDTWAKCYKTFFVRDLINFIIS